MQSINHYLQMAYNLRTSFWRTQVFLLNSMQNWNQKFKSWIWLEFQIQKKSYLFVFLLKKKSSYDHTLHEVINERSHICLKIFFSKALEIFHQLEKKRKKMNISRIFDFEKVSRERGIFKRVVNFKNPKINHKSC